MQVDVPVTVAAGRCRSWCSGRDAHGDGDGPCSSATVDVAGVSAWLVDTDGGGEVVVDGGVLAGAEQVRALAKALTELADRM